MHGIRLGSDDSRADQLAAVAGEEALRLQRPLSDRSLTIVAKRTSKDGEAAN
jgi:hypothetical protein